MKEKYKKDGVINQTQSLLSETKQEEKERREALKKSPRLKDLSEPYVTDNGRTMVYFKKGDDVIAKGEEFEKHRNDSFRKAFNL